MRFDFSSKISAIALILFVFLFSACGGAATQKPPTATAFPTFSYVAPTVAAPVLTIVAVEATTSSTLTPDPDLVELGKGRYVALECGSCHGDDGKGTDKGSPLVGMTLSEADFITFLRTGGNVGNSHLYSTNRLSDTGGAHLYLYVVSLSQSK